MVKNLPAMPETGVPSLVWEDPLEKENGCILQYSYLENPIYIAPFIFPFNYWWANQNLFSKLPA